MENLQIKFDSDVRSFFYWLMVEMELGASFHPDTPFEDYDKQNEDYPDEIHSVFNPEFASLLQERLTECFEVCEHSGLDIYEIGLQMAQRLGFSPRPDEMEVNGYKIEWTGEKWISTDRKGTVRGFQYFQEVVEDCLQP